MDDNLNQLGQKASQSVLDMIRWTNYLIDCTFQYEESVQKNYSLNEKVDQYIREHYRENIGRTEIAEQFYLAPEYLSKTYKKLTGRTIKDTITEYRIDEAKRMLERGERVSDVAETVGFDNLLIFLRYLKNIQACRQINIAKIENQIWFSFFESMYPFLKERTR